MRYRITTVKAAFLLVFLFYALPAHAEVPRLNRLERATVRVFTCRSLSLKRLSHEGREVVVAVPEVGHGSGIAVTEDGLILTARHVVQDASGLAVKLPLAKQAIPAVVVYEDPDMDFAFIKVKARLPNHITLPQPNEIKTLSTRDSLFSIGYPLDPAASTPTTQEGIVSRMTEEGLLQTSAALNPGHSGGPAFYEHRRRTYLIGMAIARHRVGEGMGFILPIRPIVQAWNDRNIASDLAPRVMKQYQQHPRLWRSMERYSLLVAEMTEAFFDRDNPSHWFNMPRSQGEGVPAFMEGLSELATEDMLPEAQLLVSGYLWNMFVATGNEEALRLCVNIVMQLRDTQPEVFGRSSFAQGLVRVVEAARAEGRMPGGAPGAGPGGRGSTGPPGLGQPSMGQPSMGQPGMGQPGFGQPGFGGGGGYGGSGACGVENGPCCGGSCAEGLTCLQGVCQLAQECSRDRACGEGQGCWRGHCVESPRFPLFRMLLGGGMAIDDHPDAPWVNGGGGSVAGLFQVLRLGDRTPWRFSLVVGADLTFGGWRKLYAMTAMANVGARFLIGSHRVAATVGLYYRLGAVLAEGRTAFAYLSYRALAGVQFSSFELGLSWSETGRSADTTFRLLELYLSWGY